MNMSKKSLDSTIRDKGCIQKGIMKRKKRVKTKKQLKKREKEESSWGGKKKSCHIPYPYILFSPVSHNVLDLAQWLVLNSSLRKVIRSS